MESVEAILACVLGIEALLSVMIAIGCLFALSVIGGVVYLLDNRDARDSRGRVVVM